MKLIPIVLSAALAFGVVGVNQISANANSMTSSNTKTDMSITAGDLSLNKWARTLPFEAITLSDLANGAVTKSVTLPAGSFEVTNYTGRTQSWTLAAAVTEFTDGTNTFDGSLAIGDQQNKLIASSDLMGMQSIASEVTGTDLSDYKWQSKSTKDYLTVPMGTKIGNYQATVRYQLQQGLPLGD